MAKADYRLCDVCDCKVFYDANLNYEPTTNPPNYYKLDYLGDWKVICEDCYGKGWRCEVKKVTEALDQASPKLSKPNEPDWIVAAKQLIAACKTSKSMGIYEDEKRALAMMEAALEKAETGQ